MKDLQKVKTSITRALPASGHIYMTECKILELVVGRRYAND